MRKMWVARGSWLVARGSIVAELFTFVKSSLSENVFDFSMDMVIIHSSFTNIEE